MVQRLLALISLCLSLFFPLSAWGQKQVLVVESYHSEFSWDAEYSRALRQHLGNRVLLRFVQLDTKRTPAEKVRLKAEEILHSISLSPPDLVIVADDAALRMVGSRLAPSHIPVIYLGINNNPRNDGVPLGANISGVLERPLILRNVLGMKTSISGMRRLLLLFDDDLTSRIIQQEAFSGKNSLQFGSIRVDMVRVSRFSDWKRTLQRAPQDYQAVWIGLYFALHDDQGNSVSSDEVLRWSNQQAQLPLFGFWDFSVGKGKTAGGLILSGYEQGMEAARMAESVLFNQQSLRSRFPVTPSNGRYVFSRSELSHFGIRLAPELLPRVQWVD